MLHVCVMSLHLCALHSTIRYLFLPMVLILSIPELSSYIPISLSLSVLVSSRPFLFLHSLSSLLH